MNEAQQVTHKAVVTATLPPKHQFTANMNPQKHLVEREHGHLYVSMIRYDNSYMV